MPSDREIAIIDRLEAAGFFCRRYHAGNVENIANAVRTIWRHMCDLDEGNLEGWRDSTVGDLVDAACGVEGWRNFGNERSKG